MKLFWQKAEVQKFEHAKDFAEEYNIGKNDFILASKSTYETYFAPLGLEAHVEFKSKYGKGEPTDVMLSLIHISEPTRPVISSRMPSSA